MIPPIILEHTTDGLFDFELNSIMGKLLELITTTQIPENYNLQTITIQPGLIKLFDNQELKAWLKKGINNYSAKLLQKN